MPLRPLGRGKLVIARPIGRGNLMRLLVIMIVPTPRQIASVVPPMSLLRKDDVIASAAWQSHEATCYHDCNYTSADCFSRASLAKTSTIMCKTPGCPERSRRVIASAAWQSHEATCYHDCNYTSADCFGRASLAKTSTILCKTPACPERVYPEQPVLSGDEGEPKGRVIARPIGRGNPMRLLVIMIVPTPAADCFTSTTLSTGRRS